jgi:arylsulfatase A-like enzyme
LNPPERNPAGLVRSIVLGLFVGATFGAVEMAARLWGNDDPSVARRAPELLLYAVTWNALAGAVLFLLAALVARFGRGRSWPTAREGPAAIQAGTVTALGATILALVLLGERLLDRPATIRAATLLLVLSVAVLAGWFVARRLSARPGGRVARLARQLERPWVLVACGALLLFGAGGLTVTRQGRVLLDATAPPVEVDPGDAPDVLVVMIDTLRADALGCYGGEARTPNMDALAARGVVFEDVFAPSSWTLPSVASLFTSTYPWQHGCTDFDRRIAGPLPSLPELLRDAGYRCRGVVGNPFVDESRGFARGFEVFDVYTHEVERRLFVTRFFELSLELTRLLVDRQRSLVPWLEPRPPFLSTRLTFYAQDEDLNDRVRSFAWPVRDRPAFTYVHYVAPHTPYLEHPLPFLKTQPPGTEDNVEELRARYLEEVAYTDRAVGELLEALESDRILEDTIVVITSDHGEEFLEHGGWEHGTGLYQEVVRIPLIVAGPGIAEGRRVARRVQLVDVAPTLLELAGLEVPESFVGASLVPELAAGAAPGPEASVFCEVETRALTRGERFVGVVAGEWKVVRRRSKDGALVEQEIYHLPSDPGEHTPLSEPMEEMGALLEALDAYESLQADHGSRPLTPDELEKIQALGYGGEGGSR